MIPTRFKLVAVTFTLTTLLYVDRIAISAAKEPITGELALTDTAFGWVLSAFALGYALFQTPAGILADKYGPRVILASIVILWSIFTGLTGLAWGLVSLLLFRFLFGLAEAGAFPACARAFYAWLPTGERALAQGVNFSGSRLGAAFALPVIAAMLTTFGWREAFLILGGIGILWAIAWYWWFRDQPEEHAAVSSQELAVITAGREQEDEAAAPIPAAPPIGQFLRNRNVLLLMGQYFASNFTFFFCLTWLFPYLKETYSLSTLDTGFLTAVPLIGGAIGNWVAGSAVDTLYRRGWGDASRRYVAMAGFALAATGLLLSMNADSAGVAVAWLTLAIFGADLTLPPSWTSCIDVGGRHSGSVSGMMNMAGNVGSFIVSLAFPYLLLAFGSAQAFFIIGAVLNVGALLAWMNVRTNSKPPTMAAA